MYFTGILHTLDNHEPHGTFFICKHFKWNHCPALQFSFSQHIILLPSSGPLQKQYTSQGLLLPWTSSTVFVTSPSEGILGLVYKCPITSGRITFTNRLSTCKQGLWGAASAGLTFFLAGSHWHGKEVQDTSGWFLGASCMHLYRMAPTWLHTSDSSALDISKVQPYKYSGHSQRHRFFSQPPMFCKELHFFVMVSYHISLAQHRTTPLLPKYLTSPSHKPFGRHRGFWMHSVSHMNERCGYLRGSQRRWRR